MGWMERSGLMTIKVLKSAIWDLKEIHETLNGFGELPVNKFRLSFEKFSTQVTATPFMCPIYAHAPTYRRALLEYGYLLFYQVNEVDHVVEVYRVLHGKRNASEIIGS